MNVLVTTESRFDRTPDGACWTIGWAGYSFWQRYLDVFDEVRIVARVREAATVPSTAVRANGERVSLVPLPFYLGPWDYFRRLPTLRRAVQSIVTSTEAIVVRAPGAAGSLVLGALRGTNRPYGIEVVGDPYEVFAPGAVRSILRPLLRWWLPRTLRRQCAGACASSYVTAATLQRRYPASANVLTTSYSSIDLPDNAFVREPRAPGTLRPRRIVYIGSLEQLYKGPDVLIDAVAIASSRGLDIETIIIGEGKYRSDLEGRAKERKVGHRINFVGHLPPGERVRAELDRADLFVLPSRTEGLPRALLEAMARGVPCIASNTGGIPELLNPSELVPPGEAAALASKLAELFQDPQRLSSLSRQHLQTALQYHIDVLRPRRKAFYLTVLEATRQWQQAGSRDLRIKRQDQP